MSASRITKDAGLIAVPFLWGSERNVLPAVASHPSKSEVNHSATAELKVQEIYQQGYREGEAAGKVAASEAVGEQLAQIVTSLADQRASLFRSAQADLLRLSIAIARRILHREIIVSPDALEGIISVTLERLDDQEVYRLRVHPSFLASIAEHLARRNGRQKVEVVADPSLERGGCVFETQHGEVDAGIESQLSEIERGLADRLDVQL